MQQQHEKEVATLRNELLILILLGILAVWMILGGTRAQKSPDTDKKTITITVTTSSVWDRSKPFKEIDLSFMQYLRQGDITVYFEPEQRKLAQEVAHALRETWNFVTKRLGIMLGTFGVALIALSETERAEIGGIYIKLKQEMQVPPEDILLQQFPESPKPPFPVEVPLGLPSFKEADLKVRQAIYHTMPHEALHRTIEKALERGLDRGWKLDPQTRCLEDGLAEYIGYIVAQKFDSEVHKQVLEGRQRHVQEVLESRERPTYDLTKEFPGDITITPKGERSREISPSKGPSPEEIAGYGVSLAFWLQIAQKHGEGVIKTFWQRISQRGFPNAREAARILSELTGEDIWTKLQTMDLQDVLRTLEAATGGP